MVVSPHVLACSRIALMGTGVVSVMTASMSPAWANGPKCCQIRSLGTATALSVVLDPSTPCPISFAKLRARQCAKGAVHHSVAPAAKRPAVAAETAARSAISSVGKAPDVSLAGSTDVCASRSEFNSCDLYPLEEARGATRSSGLSSAHESGGPSPVLHEMCVHSLGPGLKGQSHQG
jgi:transcription elongation factor